MEELFIKRLQKIDVPYIKINDKNLFEKIYDLFENRMFKNCEILMDTLFDNVDKGTLFYYFGIFFLKIKLDYNLAKKIFVISCWNR